MKAIRLNMRPSSSTSARREAKPRRKTPSLYVMITQSLSLTAKLSPVFSITSSHMCVHLTTSIGIMPFTHFFLCYAHIIAAGVDKQSSLFLYRNSTSPDAIHSFLGNQQKSLHSHFATFSFYRHLFIEPFDTRLPRLGKGGHKVCS